MTSTVYIRDAKITDHREAAKTLSQFRILANLTGKAFRRAMVDRVAVAGDGLDRRSIKEFMEGGVQPLAVFSGHLVQCRPT